ncbi:MAG: hypothetical protein DRR19_17525 [Candidatus Parabeggiatoa sp. nov. 1]|nr:MAG: hypothetical protein DRR19_17525 [Gammaproteobacteria bacterium]
MNTQTNTEITEKFKGVINSERTIALLGIAAHRQNSKASPCPSDEQLAEFISGGLKGKQRQTMLAHLNRCSTCYYHWLEVASYLDSIEEATEKSNEFQQVREKGWQKWRDLRSFNGSFAVRYFAVPVTITITAILLIVVTALFVMKPPPTLNDNINAGFEVAATVQNPEQLTEQLAQLLKDTSLGINDPDISQPILAFSAGVEVAKATLTDITPSTEMSVWADSQWANEYELGRWFVLLWTMVQTPAAVPADFWRQQRAIGETLQARFSTRSPRDDITETILEVMLKPALSLLSQLQNKPNDQEVTAQLREHLAFAIWGISQL